MIRQLAAGDPEPQINYGFELTEVAYLFKCLSFCILFYELLFVGSFVNFELVFFFNGFFFFVYFY